MVNVLQDAVEPIGEDVLGLKTKDIGTHLIRLGTAMSFYLGECPVYTIMMIQRWTSDAFLRYICKQVKQFRNNDSQRMLHFQFHHQISKKETRISHPDLIQHNHPDNAKTKRNVSGNLDQQLQLPVFSPFQ